MPSMGFFSTARPKRGFRLSFILNQTSTRIKRIKLHLREPLPGSAGEDFMKYSNWGLFGLIALSMGLCNQTSAEVLRFQVQGPDGKPLSDAVITLFGPSALQPAAAAASVTGSGSSAAGSIAADVTGGSDVYVMDQRNKQFSPYVLTVPPGAPVSFPNSDDIRHHVYSFSPTKPFELRLYKGEPANPIVFDQPGVVVLGCNIHDGMVGYIYVAESPVFSKTDRNGSATVDIDYEGPLEIAVWHPRLKRGTRPPRRSLSLPLTEPLQAKMLDFTVQITPPEPFRTPANVLEARYQELRRTRAGMEGRRMDAR